MPAVHAPANDDNFGCFLLPKALSMLVDLCLPGEKPRENFNEARRVVHALSVR